MIEIKRIRSADEGGAVLLECEFTDADIVFRDGREVKHRGILLLPEQYAEIRPKKGPVTNEQFGLLADADAKCRALRAGRRLLGYGSNSASQIALKLRHKGYSREAAEYAGARMRESGEINENADALRLAERMVSAGKGRTYIVAALRSKSYSDAAVCAVRSYLETVDFGEICRSVIEKKWGGLPDDRAARQKCIAALMRQGFTVSDIRDGMKR